MRNIIVLFVVLFFCSCDKIELNDPAVYNCQLNFPDDSANHPQAAQFQAALDELTRFLPGVSVAIRTADGHNWTGASGMADIAQQIPLQPCNSLMVGSISKVFTATTLLKLAEDGLLSVDDSLSKWLPADLIDPIANADLVTLRQMLSHTSGIPDYNDTEFTLDAINDPVLLLTAEEKLEYTHDLPADFPPNTQYFYSNSNFVLLGLVIERVTNKSLPQAIQDIILDPLGLESAAAGDAENPIPSNVVRPYLNIRGDQFFDNSDLEQADAATGDGNVGINMQDLQRFIEALWNREIIDTNLDLMVANLVEKPSDEADFEDWNGEFTGLGIDLFKSPYGDAYGHTGAIFAFTASMFHFPEENATLVMAFNGNSIKDELFDKKMALQDRLLELMFE